MNGKEKRIYKNHYNERKQSLQREEERKSAARIQELIQQTRSNLGMPSENSIMARKSDAHNARR